MNAPPPYRQPKKGPHVVVILLGIVGVIGMLTVVGIGIAAFMIRRSPEASGLLKVFAEIVAMQAKAMKAPGTKELRGIGCQQAMVMNFGDVQRALGALPDAGISQQPMPFEEMVVCSVTQLKSKSAPSCDDASTRYLSAVGPRKAPYVVMVQVQGSQEPKCSIVYAADGTKQGNLDDPNAFGPVLQPPESGDVNEETQ